MRVALRKRHSVDVDLEGHPDFRGGRQIKSLRHDADDGVASLFEPELLLTDETGLKLRNNFTSSRTGQLIEYGELSACTKRFPKFG